MLETSSSMSNTDPSSATKIWKSPIPQKRWLGFRREYTGTPAFESLERFQVAQMMELGYGLADRELETLGRLVKRGQTVEIEVFIRTHGPNPIFDPGQELELKVGVARADVVDLSAPPTAAANQAVLNGEVAYALFHGGEASRFQEGPFYSLNPLAVA